MYYETMNHPTTSVDFLNLYQSASSALKLFPGDDVR